MSNSTELAAVTVHHPSEASRPSVTAKAQRRSCCCQRWSQWPLAFGGSLTLAGTGACVVAGKVATLVAFSPYLFGAAAAMGVLTVGQALSFWDIRRLTKHVDQLSVDDEADESAINGLKEELTARGLIIGDVNKLGAIGAAIGHSLDERAKAHAALMLEWQAKVNAADETVRTVNEVNSRFQEALSMLADGAKQTEERAKNFDQMKIAMTAALAKLKAQNDTLSKLSPTLLTAAAEQCRVAEACLGLIAAVERQRAAEQLQLEAMEKARSQIDESDDKLLASAKTLHVERVKIDAVEGELEAGIKKRTEQLAELATQMPKLVALKEQMQALIHARDNQLAEFARLRITPIDTHI